MMMSEERISKLEGAMTKLADVMSEFIAVESARKEREKHQGSLNEKVITFIDNYNENDKPVVNVARGYQKWMSFFVGKVILPSVIVAILLSAGYQFFGKVATSQETSKTTSKLDN